MKKQILLAFLMLTASTALARMGKAYNCVADGPVATVTCDSGTLVIQSYAAYGWKVSSLPDGVKLADERPSITLTGQYRGTVAVTLTERPDEYVLTAAASAVHVNKTTSLLSFYDNGVKRVSEKDGIDNTLATKTISFEPQADAAFYGGGYNGRYGNLKGRTLTMENTQNYNWDQRLDGPNNICVPFIVSTNGYGILFEDHYIDSRINLSASDGISYVSQSPTPISYVYVGSSDGTQAGVMKTYGMLTGMHELPPYWAMGYITCRYGYRSQDETLGVITSLRDIGMPVSGIVLDLYWEGDKTSGMGNLDWYKPMWPDAKRMMDSLRHQGVHTVVITEPYFAEETTNYRPLLDLGLLADPDCPDMGWVSENKVGIIDFMTPRAMDWMWNFYRARTDEGVDGWWLDLGEPEMIGDSVIHADGSTTMQAHNEFGQTWIAGLWNKWKQHYPDRRPFFLPRSGTSGMQRYATFPWTGDIARSWSGMRSQVPALINGGMSGLGYLSSDIGGFVANLRNGGHIINPNLYLRWFQMGVFTPVLRTHGHYLPEPYQPEYGEYRERLKDLMNLRYRMLPYNYSAAWRNSVEGTPITTPLGFYTTETEEVNSVNDEYLFGPNILVSPVMDEGATGRRVVFPSGEWIDPVNGKAYTGGTAIDFESADMRLPYFVRRGTFTPLYTQREYTSTDDIDHSALTVYYPMARDKAWDFTLYDDDKTSARVGDRYELITFSGVTAGDSHTITIDTSCKAEYDGRPLSRVLNFCIPMCTGAVSSVTSETLKVREMHYDSAAGVLRFTVDLPSASARHNIVIR